MPRPLRGRRREAGWIDRASCPDDPLAGVLPATLRADPPPACSWHRGGKATGQSQEQNLFPVGAHLVRDRGVSITSAVAHWVRSHKGRVALSLRCAAQRHELSPIPCVVVRGGRSGPAGVPDRTSGTFRPGRSPVEKPGRPSRTGWAQPRQRHAGCLSLWLLSLGQARESDPAFPWGLASRRRQEDGSPPSHRDFLRSQVSQVAISLQPKTDETG